MELKEVNKVFYNELDRNRTFTEYDSTYVFTTENISGYIPDLNGKDVLTVCSSGDHYLNAYLHGANRVDLFDINRLTLMFLKLKRTALMNLDREVFIEYFGIDNKNNIFNYEIYRKFAKYLDEDVYEYFNYLYKLCKYSGNYLYFATSLFFTDRSDPYTIYSSNDYLTPSNYSILKNILFNKPFNSEFICTDVNNLSCKLSSNYDAIFLSNIQDYQNSSDYINTVKDLHGHLKDNGSLFFAYCYHATKAYHDKVLREFVDKNPEAYSILIKSIYSDGRREDVTDKVLVLGKYI